MEQTPLEEQVEISSPPPIQQPQTQSSIIARNIISVSAAALGASFFMPWAVFLGANLSGLEIQKHVNSYRFVWLLPVCAVITLLMNIAGAQQTTLMRRITGIVPFAILAYSLKKFGSDLFQIISWGGWIALASGFVLVIAPSPVKSQPKA